YNSLHGRSKAEFYNGNKRVLDVKQRDLDIGMGFGFNRSAFYIYLVGVLSFGFGDRLEAWTEYADGTKSFGNENYLNGIYEVGARLSARPALRIGISPTDRITLMFSLDKLREGSESNYYTDNFAGDLFVEGGSDNSEIGVDWLDYVNDMSGYILEDRELLRSGWSGLQMRFGICLNLFSEDL
ncbi:MAG: hypothetical protein JNM00_07450, partial [Flavobacteriales bacterium]|nr:hypothetical protein [Flavobacteriales bacterium]